MAKSFKAKHSERIIFPFDKQQQFLLMAREKLDIPWSSFANRMRIHKRTLNDWRRGEYSMPLSVLKRICRISKVKMPTDIKIKDAFWYVFKGARVGGKAVYRKYGRIGGSPEYRKKKWYEWWEKKGKFIKRKIFKRKLIKKPTKNRYLAEFIGIMLGDGGITPSQIQITLNSKNEVEYVEFVKNLIKKLFKLNSGIYKFKTNNAVRIQISSRELVDYLLGLGLNQGKGQKPRDIPQWIFENLKYQKACLRGIFDTEGCVYTHTYRVNRRVYSYKKLCFRNRSQQLLESIAKILVNLNFKPKITNGQSVSLYDSNETKRYFREIGTHNSKNLGRFNN